MKKFCRVNQHMMKIADDASCIDANYHKGLLANQERTAVYEVVYRHKCGGGTTDVSRPIKARYGAIGHQEYVPKHKGESSGVLEETIKVRDGTSKGFSEVPIGGVVDMAIPNSKTRRGRVQDMGETVGTLDTGSNHAKVEGKYRIRKLTPRECFRLQGWTDDYFEKAQFVNSDSQLYKQAGNGVTVTVIEAIARRFEDGTDQGHADAE